MDAARIPPSPHRAHCLWLFLPPTLIILGLAGCAFAPTDEGVGVLGFKVGEVAGSAAAVGEGAGMLAALLGGGPGTVAAISGIATIAAGIFGVKKAGDAKAAEARREGERAGWDEAAVAHSPPLPSTRLGDPGGVGPVPPVASVPEGKSESAKGAAQ